MEEAWKRSIGCRVIRVAKFEDDDPALKAAINNAIQNAIIPCSAVIYDGDAQTGVIPYLQRHIRGRRVYGEGFVS